jgi:Tol biopolymer transport system component
VSRFRRAHPSRHWQAAIPAALLALAVISPAAAPASFSGANGKIFYQAPQFGDKGPSDVFSVNPDGSENIDLTAENGFNEERPAGSADGLHVTFQTFRDKGWNVFAMNTDGSGLINLTQTVNPVINFEPTWSPDGSRVAFMRQNLTPGEQDIWTVGANGSNPINLTNSPGVEETSPEYSPDGTKIVYISTGPNPCCVASYNNDIWVMNADGTNQTQLTTTDFPIQSIAPAWSADGTKIAFSRTESKTDDGLHVMDANGANQTRLLNEGAPILTGTVSWSPDGTMLAIEHSSGGIATMSAAGGASTPLVSSSYASYLTWVPATSAAPPGGGGSTGALTPAPIAIPPAVVKPRVKALKCRKGKRKKIVKGKARCVKKHARHRGKKAGK